MSGISIRDKEIQALNKIVSIEKSEFEIEDYIHA